jgi:hypothetical protein
MLRAAAPSPQMAIRNRPTYFFLSFFGLLATFFRLLFALAMVTPSLQSLFRSAIHGSRYRMLRLLPSGSEKPRSGDFRCKGRKHGSSATGHSSVAEGILSGQQAV